MSTAIIIAISIVLVLLVAFLLLAVQAGVSGAAAELIADAEKLDVTGPAKMAFVVQNLATTIPAIVRKVFTDEKLQGIAQSIFVWMRKYAQAYEAAQASAPPDAQEPEINREAVAALVGELFGLGLDALQEKAAEHGIQLPEKATKKDIAEAIIRAALEKT